MRGKLSMVQKEVLIMLFKDWAKLPLEEYTEPMRMGTPRGELIGLSSLKYQCALMQSLYGSLTLPEIAVNLPGAVSAGQIRVWRTEQQFKEVAKEASEKFATFLMMEILSEEDNIKRLFLSEIFVMLPGFDINHSIFLTNDLYRTIKFIDKGINDYIDNKIDKYGYIGIGGITGSLIDYYDIFRLLRRFADDNEKKSIEDKIKSFMNPILEDIENLLRKGKEVAVRDDLFRKEEKIGVLWKKEVDNIEVIISLFRI